MKILAIDTATEACSAALLIDGKIESVFELAPRDHTKLILKMVDGLLTSQGLSVSALDALAYGRGPGSFTGVRIAAGVIQGLAFTDDKPVIGVSNLAAIAQGVFDEYSHHNVLCAIDARMQEIYWAQYEIEQGIARLQGKETVTSADKLEPVSNQGWAGAGTGWSEYAEDIESAIGVNVKNIYPHYLPTASSIAKLAAVQYQSGNYVSASEALPVYLRDNVAKKAKSTV